MYSFNHFISSLVKSWIDFGPSRRLLIVIVKFDPFRFLDVALLGIRNGGFA